MLLGIDLSFQHASVILADDSGQPSLALRSDLPRDAGSPALWTIAMRTTQEVLRRAIVNPTQVASIAVSFPALLDAQGVVQKDVCNPGWEGVDLLRATREHLGVTRVAVENRTICQALGELNYGVLRTNTGSRNIADQSTGNADTESGSTAGASWLFAGIGRHISGVASVNGQLLRGANLAAVDLGAICIERDGVLCSNGRHGCLEGYCGGEAFLERARSYGIQLAAPAEIWQQINGNFAAKSLCDDYVARLAQGLGIAITMLDPGRVVIGGSLVEALGETLLTPLRLRLRDFCPTRASQNLQLLAAQLGEDAAAMGAVALARQNL